MEHKELLERAEADGMEFISLQFTDILGTIKSVTVGWIHLRSISGWQEEDKT